MQNVRGRKATIGMPKNVYCIILYNGAELNGVNVHTLIGTEKLDYF